jgi:hypothetical protein
LRRDTVSVLSAAKMGRYEVRADKSPFHLNILRSLECVETSIEARDVLRA